MTGVKSTTLSLHTLEKHAEANLISLYPNSAAQTQAVLAKLKKRHFLPSELQSEDAEFNKAVGFYYHLVKPLMVRTGTRKVTPADISRLCRRLASRQHINVKFYYAFLKKPSASRSGSPDGVIDFAELEMLKYFATLTGVAKQLGFSLRITLIDEAPICPAEILKFTTRDLQITQDIAASYLAKANANDSVFIKSITDSVVKPLGGEFNRLYEPELHYAISQIKLELSANIHSPATTRMIAWLDCLLDETLSDQFGLSPDKINEIRTTNWTPQALLCLNESLLTALLHASGHFQVIMNLRRAAKQFVIEQRFLNSYPEYDDSAVLHVGVARSYRRWSILPHPVRYQGQTRNPSYGLALYNQDGTFKGVVAYSQFKDEPTVKMIWHDIKPLAIIQAPALPATK